MSSCEIKPFLRKLYVTTKTKDNNSILHAEMTGLIVGHIILPSGPNFIELLNKQKKYKKMFC